MQPATHAHTHTHTTRGRHTIQDVGDKETQSLRTLGNKSRRTETVGIINKTQLGGIIIKLNKNRKQEKPNMDMETLGSRGNKTQGQKSDIQDHQQIISLYSECLLLETQSGYMINA